MRVVERYESLRQVQPHLRLFALIDGLGYEQQSGGRLHPKANRYPLFDGTPDAALAAAGPWLLDVENDDELREYLLTTQAQAPYVSWLLAEMPLHGLAQLLQLRWTLACPMAPRHFCASTTRAC